MVCPSPDAPRDSGKLKTIGEFILAIGDCASAVSETTLKLISKGAKRVYAYNYGDAIDLATYSQVGFSFEQPQIILVRNVGTEWSPVKSVNKQSFETLDQFKS